MELVSWLFMLLLVVLIVSGIFATLIGVVTLVQFARTKHLPMDESNRINHIRLWWFVLTRPELFVSSFEWLKNDELDNMKK